MAVKYLPGKVVIGNTFSFTVIPPNNYTPSNSYSAYLKFRGPCDIDLSSTTSNNSFVFKETATETLDWKEGTYKYVLYVETTGSPGVDSYTLETGYIELEKRADLLDSGEDMLSFYHTMRDAIQAVLTNKATKDQSSYSIAGRSLSRFTWDELIAAYDKFDFLYKRELNKSLPARNQVKFRMK